jgi:hypothetical protein
MVVQIVRGSRAHHYTPSPGDQPTPAPPIKQRLRLVIMQETPGVWLVRGLEHDVVAEARSIGARSMLVMISCRSNRFDRRLQNSGGHMRLERVCRWPSSA